MCYKCSDDDDMEHSEPAEPFVFSKLLSAVVWGAYNFLEQLGSELDAHVKYKAERKTFKGSVARGIEALVKADDTQPPKD